MHVLPTGILSTPIEHISECVFVRQSPRNDKNSSTVTQPYNYQTGFHQHSTWDHSDTFASIRAIKPGLERVIGVNFLRVHGLRPAQLSTAGLITNHFLRGTSGFSCYDRVSSWGEWVMEGYMHLSSRRIWLPWCCYSTARREKPLTGIFMDNHSVVHGVLPGLDASGYTTFSHWL